MSEKQRGPYEAKAAADKKRYEDEKAKYNVRPSADLPYISSLTLAQANDEEEEGSE